MINSNEQSQNNQIVFNKNRNLYRTVVKVTVVDEMEKIHTIWIIKIKLDKIFLKIEFFKFPNIDD